jgi:hypothetical protein
VIKEINNTITYKLFIWGDYIVNLYFIYNACINSNFNQLIYNR